MWNQEAPPGLRPSPMAPAPSPRVADPGSMLAPVRAKHKGIDFDAMTAHPRPGHCDSGTAVAHPGGSRAWTALPTSGPSHGVRGSDGESARQVVEPALRDSDADFSCQVTPLNRCC